MRDLKNVKGETNAINVVEGDVNNRGNIVYGTLVINNTEKNQSEINYDVNCGRIKMNSRISLITGGTFSIAGLIGLISSLFTIKEALINPTTASSNMNLLYFLLFFFGMGLVMLVKITNKKGILSVFSNSIIAMHFAKFKDGSIRSIKVKGKCPKENCGGNLRFKFNSDNGEYYFICTRNSSQHRYEFDFTTLKYE